MSDKTLGIIGFGAFGEFLYPHISPYFPEIKIYDPESNDFEGHTLENVCGQDIILYAAPVQALEETLKTVSPLLQAGQLFIDVCSVKVKPAQLMKKYLKYDVDIISLHPLFGPQSGKNGIEGLNIALCNIHSDRVASVKEFLEQLGLNVIETTPEKHDQDMAYVMGVSHMVAKVFAMMDIPETQQTTKTYELLCSMVDMVKDDSDELFRAIQEENPYVLPTKEKFFSAVKDLEKRLGSTGS